MKQLQRMLLLAILVIIVGMGAALTLKVSVGVGAWDALAQSISYLSTVKVGTVGMIMNSSCVLGQLLVLRKDFQLKYLLQVPVVILLGVVVNFILYDVLGNVTIDSYVMRLALLCLAITVLAFAVAAVMVLDVVTFPLEGFCLALAKKTRWKFVTLRQSADVFSILLAVLLTFTLALPLTLREGTIIGMVFFAPLIGYFMKKLQPVFQKLELLQEDLGEIKTEKGSSKAYSVQAK